jgi:hypothetical protein
MDDLYIACGNSNFIENLVTTDSNLSILETALALPERLYVAKNIYANKNVYAKGLSLSCGMINYGSTILYNGLEVYGDLKIYGSTISVKREFMTFCNADINGPFNSYDFAYFASNVLIDSNLEIAGNLNVSNVANFDSNIITNGSIYLSTNNNSNWWSESIEYSSNNSDLVFESHNGTRVTFTDEFSPEVLNFTGKHRCTMLNLDRYTQKNLLGKIVIATGKYRNLNNKNKLDISEIDEAIPIVELCEKINDKRVFGIIGGFDNKGLFKLGNLNFSQPNCKNRSIIHTVGEGCIYVCNINGNIENGDYITTSPIPGYGMKQNENFVLNYTVAKITCDCNFDCKNTKEIIHNNNRIKICLVGCTYKC